MRGGIAASQAIVARGATASVASVAISAAATAVAIAVFIAALLGGASSTAAIAMAVLVSNGRRDENHLQGRFQMAGPQPDEHRK
jgi:hypothetical protein